MSAKVLTSDQTKREHDNNNRSHHANDNNTNNCNGRSGIWKFPAQFFDWFSPELLNADAAHVVGIMIIMIIIMIIMIIIIVIFLLII